MTLKWVGATQWEPSVQISQCDHCRTQGEEPHPCSRGPGGDLQCERVPRGRRGQGVDAAGMKGNVLVADYAAERAQVSLLKSGVISRYSGADRPPR